MLYDIIFLVIICLLTFSGYRRGMVSSLMSLLSFVLAAVVAIGVSRWLSPVVYDSFVGPMVINAVEDSLESLSQQEGFEAANKAVMAIPAVLLAVLQQFDYTAPRLTEYLLEVQEEGSFGLPQAVSVILRSPATGIITCILFVLFFIVFLIIFQIIARKLGGKIRIPLLSLADSLIGAGLGFVEGVIVVFLLATLIWVALPFISSDIEIFSMDYVLSSKVISFVCSKELGFLLRQLTYKISTVKELGV